MDRIVQVIGRENRICELAIRQLQNKCNAFEEKHNISSDDFLRLWHQGKMGDDTDFFEWKALIEGIREWEHTKEELMRLAS